MAIVLDKKKAELLVVQPFSKYSQFLREIRSATCVNLLSFDSQLFT